MSFPRLRPWLASLLLVVLLVVLLSASNSRSQTETHVRVTTATRTVGPTPLSISGRRAVSSPTALLPDDEEEELWWWSDGSSRRGPFHLQKLRSALRGISADDRRFVWSSEWPQGIDWVPISTAVRRGLLNVTIEPSETGGADAGGDGRSKSVAARAGKTNLVVAGAASISGGVYRRGTSFKQKIRERLTAAAGGSDEVAGGELAAWGGSGHRGPQSAAEDEENGDEREAADADEASFVHALRNASNGSSINCSLQSVDAPRYVAYASHGGYGAQLRALRNALLVARTLRRTLVVPPLWEVEAQPALRHGRRSCCNRSLARKLAREYVAGYEARFTAGGHSSWSRVLNLDTVSRAAGVRALDFADFVKRHPDALSSRRCAPFVRLAAVCPCEPLSWVARLPQLRRPREGVLLFGSLLHADAIQEAEVASETNATVNSSTLSTAATSDAEAPAAAASSLRRSRYSIAAPPDWILSLAAPRLVSPLLKHIGMRAARQMRTQLGDAQGGWYDYRAVLLPAPPPVEEGDDDRDEDDDDNDDDDDDGHDGGDAPRVPPPQDSNASSRGGGSVAPSPDNLLELVALWSSVELHHHFFNRNTTSTFKSWGWTRCTRNSRNCRLTSVPHIYLAAAGADVYADRRVASLCVRFACIDGTALQIRTWPEWQLLVKGEGGLSDASAAWAVDLAVSLYAGAGLYSPSMHNAPPLLRAVLGANDHAAHVEDGLQSRHERNADLLLLGDSLRAAWGMMHLPRTVGDATKATAGLIVEASADSPISAPADGKQPLSDGREWASAYRDLVCLLLFWQGK